MKPDASDASPNPPWWREPMMWVVLGGPAVVVVAAILTGVIAWRGADQVVLEPAPTATAARPALEPALNARNHAATPR